MSKYPVGGPRQPVYDLMRSLGFWPAPWTDKIWRSRGGVTVSIFGSGSMAHVYYPGGDPATGNVSFECPLDQLSDKLNAHP